MSSGTDFCVEITHTPLSPEHVISRVKSEGSGCVVTYIGLIRNYSRGKAVSSVEYGDADLSAAVKLQEICKEAAQRWQLENIAVTHRIGKLAVGDINLVIAIASAHRREGFAACRYIIDRFKKRLPTDKKESYRDTPE